MKSLKTVLEKVLKDPAIETQAKREIWAFLRTIVTKKQVDISGNNRQSNQKETSNE